MNYLAKLFSTLIPAGLTALTVSAQVEQMPAYPLITHNTYFSIWSNTNKLNESVTHHWTGKDQSLMGIIKVDGSFYRFMGEAAPDYKTVLAAGEHAAYTCKYLMETPPAGASGPTGPGQLPAWTQPGFDDKDWQTGTGPFGDNRAKAGTAWTGKDIWVRRKFSLGTLPQGRLLLKIFHDDDAEVFLNGQRISRQRGAN